MNIITFTGDPQQTGNATVRKHAVSFTNGSMSCTSSFIYSLHRLYSSLCWFQKTKTDRNRTDNASNTLLSGEQVDNSRLFNALVSMADAWLQEESTTKHHITFNNHYEEETYWYLKFAWIVIVTNENISNIIAGSWVSWTGLNGHNIQLGTWNQPCHRIAINSIMLFSSSHIGRGKTPSTTWDALQANE